jgi:hypothetical protein
MLLNKLRTPNVTGTGTRLVFLVALCIVLPWAQAARGQANVDSYGAAAGSSGGSWLLPTLLDLLLLVGIVACFVISVKVKSFLRDGELSSGWSLFSLSFVLLFAAQILSLFTDVRLFELSSSIISALRVLFVISLAWGIYFMRKVLS